MKVTPDGVRYLAAAEGKVLPIPFVLRWAVPMVCGVNDWTAWRILAWGGVGAAAGLTGALAPTWEAGLAAGLIMVALPSSRFNLRFPVLVDAPAMALAVLAAVLHHYGAPLALVVLVSLWAGACKETAPIFAAIYAWSWVPLLGLIAVPVWLLLIRMSKGQWSGPDVLDEHNAWVLQHPLKASWMYHKAQLLDGTVMLTPWGGALAGLGNPSWQLTICVVVAYGQLITATDSVRLYQWAAPMMVLAAVTAVPVVWLPLLVALTIWNPLGGDGI